MRGTPREGCISVRESQTTFANRHLSTPPDPHSRTSRSECRRSYRRAAPPLHSFFCLPAIHASRVAAAQLQDAIFAAAVASFCVPVLTVPPARVFAGVTPELGCPTRGT